MNSNDGISTTTLPLIREERDSLNNKDKNQIKKFQIPQFLQRKYTILQQNPSQQRLTSPNSQISPRKVRTSQSLKRQNKQNFTFKENQSQQSSESLFQNANQQDSKSNYNEQLQNKVQFFKRNNKKLNTFYDIEGDQQQQQSSIDLQIQQTMTQIKEGYLDIATTTIDPKVFEPFEPIQGRVPRNVEIERKKRQYLQLDLMDLLIQNGINIQEEFKQNVYGKINIQYFDDISYDDYEDCSEWIKLSIDKDTQQVTKIVTGKAFIYQQDQSYILKNIYISNYDEKTNKFTANIQQDLETYSEIDNKSVYYDDNEQVFLERIFICFDAENPLKYVKRIKNAIKKRNQCHLIILYNYIIDNMPIDNIIDMNSYQLNRIEQKILQGHQVQCDQKEIEKIMYDINQDYKRTQNKILLNIFLEQDKEHDLHPGQNMAFVVKKYCHFKFKQTKFGKLNPKRSYNIKKTFEKFKFSTLLLREESYYVLKEVHAECDKLRNMDIFNFEDYAQNQNLNVFINKQDSKLQQIVNYIKNTWIDNLVAIVNKYFKKVGKGWFNIQETNEYSFDQGKLKKLLNLLKYIMESTLQDLLKINYQKFSEFILPKIPDVVVINSLKDVNQVKQGNKSLFEIQVVKEKESQELIFSILPEVYQQNLQNVFYKPIKEIQKIPELTAFIAKNIYNDKKEKHYIQVPTLTRDKTKKYSIQYTWLNDFIDEVDKKIEICIQPLKEYIIYHERFKKIIQLNPLDVKQEMEDKEADIDILLQEIERSEQRKQEIQFEIPMSIEVGMFIVQQGDIVLEIKDKFSEISLNLKNLIYEKTMALSYYILNYQQNLLNKFYQIKPQTIEEVRQILLFIDNIPQEIDKISYEMKVYNENMLILDQLNYKVKKEQFNQRWQIFGMKKDINQKITEAKTILLEQAQTFKSQCEIDQEEIEVKIHYLEETIKEVMTYDDLSQNIAYNDLCQNIMMRISEFIDQGILLNKRQQMFDLEISNFSILVEMQDLFKNYNEFWSTSSKWISYENQVLNEPLKNISSKFTKKNQEECYNKIKKVKAYFDSKKISHMMKLSDTVYEQLENFRQKIQILQAIKREGLRERHWEQIYDILGVKNSIDIILEKRQHSFSFQYYLNLDILKFQDQIIEIAERAYREYKLELQLNEIISRWEKVQFTITKQEKTFLLKGFDDIQEMMDEDILKTQRMQFSMYKKHFEVTIISWNNNLKMMQEILEEWLKFQQKLLYLQPIFESADISEQLPGETKKFGTIQSFWKHLITNVKNNNNVQMLCLQEGILERLIDGCRSLEQIQNELTNYLERKREKFGRFYFLSNNDLIQILSIQRDPKSIIPHLNKVFENIEDIDFNQNMEITAMISKEQEVVQFEESIKTENILVEDWMKNLEAQMYKTVKIRLISCVLAGKHEFFDNLIGWIQDHPGMCIITVSKIIETLEIEKSFLALTEENELSSSDSDSDDSFEIEKVQEKKKNLFSNFVGNRQQQHLNKFKIQLQKVLNQLINTVKQKKLQSFIKITVNSLIVTVVNSLENVDKFFDAQDLQNKQKLVQKAINAFSSQQRKSVVIEPLEAKKFNSSKTNLNLDSEKQIKQQNLTPDKQQEKTIDKHQQIIQNIYNQNNSKKLSLKVQQPQQTKEQKNENKQNSQEMLDTFEWQMQLKTYMDVLQPNPECKIQCVQSIQVSGYEYLGNTQRLVITPLTEKCFITMMQAMKYLYAGALIGPAGTGKTETIKDLSKFVARQCVVFNCSEAMDYITISKFFKGLACCGSWCCFDEFNRMHTEVLSVIAQQLLFLNSTKVQQKSVLKKFLTKKINFEGSEILVKNTFSVFITLNPGYQGKVELPDNLKNQFRQMAMVIPHYEQITEIILYSYGFKEAKQLSQKINVSVKLAQDQLSSQPHYDYGMRAIKSIIIAAGQYKEEDKSNDESLEYEEDIIKKAINVVTLPKLVEQDEILFKNIVRDQFKYTVGEIVSVFSQKDQKQLQLQQHFIDIVKQNNLEPLPNHIQKLGQIQSVMKFRHGIMLLGKAGTGKSTLINILGKTLTYISEIENKGIEIDQEYKVIKKKIQKVLNYFINPKSLTLGQLFGEYLIEWRDGVFSKFVRECQNDMSNNKHWIIMDGPVDTLWIENINSVLDETRKLCLSNSQILNFTENMTMLFEIEDLENSSPSIVSRCGMVYVQDFEEQNIFILWDTWLKNIFSIKDENFFNSNTLNNKEKLIKTIYQNLQKLLPYYLEPCFKYVKYLPQTSKLLNIQDLNIIKDFLLTFECMINYQFKGIFQDEDEQNEDQESYSPVKTQQNNNKRQSKQNFGQQNEQQGGDFKQNISSLEKFRKLSMMLQPLFFQAIIWSFGSQIKTDFKEEFSNFLKKLIIKDPFTDQNKNIMQFPEKLSFFQVYFDTNEQRYIDILSKQPEFLNSGKSIYTEMFIHNKNTISYIYQFQHLIDNQKHFLVLGPKSCGKTKILQDLLNKHLDQEKFQNQIIQLSAETKITQLNEIIDSKLEKRRKRVLGPQLGKTHVIYIDDLFLPREEEYGSQPPLELLRFFIEQKGLYQKKELIFTNYEDLCFMASCNLQLVQKTHQRLLRQFIVIGMDEISQEFVQNIFVKLTSSFLTSLVGTIRTNIAEFVQSSINILNKISNELLPTPSKNFYSFTNRDIFNTYNYIIQLADPLYINNLQIWSELWYYENSRQFKDRLVTNQDINFVQSIINEEYEILIKKLNLKNKIQNTNMLWTNFQVEDDQIIEGQENKQVEVQNFTTGKKQYKQIVDIQSFLQKMENIQETYNHDNSFSISNKKQLNLIMFQDACSDIIKISRIVSINEGHSLTLGSAGKGRQSLNRLACFVADLKMFEIGLNQDYSMRIWLEDLKKVIMTAGIEKQKIAMLISCKKIISEEILENLSQILSGGEVCNLYGEKELEEIHISCKNECVKQNLIPSKTNIQNVYYERTKQNFHLMLSMSPTKYNFASRIRDYPFLVNKCSIIYLHEWSDYSLNSIAQVQINEYSQEINLTGQKEEYGNAALIMHKFVLQQSNLQKVNSKRQVHIEPIHFLDTLKIFKLVVLKKRKQLGEIIDRMSHGVSTIKHGQDQIKLMDVELNNLKPKLEKSTEEVDILLKQIAKDQIVNEQKQQQVKIEEQMAEKQEQQAIELKAQAKAGVQIADQQLQETLKNLSKLKKEHLIEIKSLGNPPLAVKTTISGLVILLESHIEQKGGYLVQGETQKDFNFFETAKRYLLNDPRELLETLQKYDKSSVTNQQLEKLNEYVIPKKEYSLQAVERTSYATKFLFLWVKCIVDYTLKYIATEPIRQELIITNQNLQISIDALKQKKVELELIKKNLLDLQTQMYVKEKEKEQLKQRSESVTKQISIARMLTSGLFKEGIRWEKDIKVFEEQEKYIIGNSLLVTIQLVNFGPFEINYRNNIYEKGFQLFKSLGILINEECTLVKFLSTQNEMYNMYCQGLPKDENSSQNAIIMKESQKKWPLLIDPQEQAQKYLNNSIFEKGRVETISENDKNIFRILEIAISVGKWIIIKTNTQEFSDSSVLESIFEKQIEYLIGQKHIKIGEKSLQMHDDYQLFILTSRNNPTYTPEIFVKLQVINFAISPQALEEQMLALVFSIENPRLEQRKINLREKIKDDKFQLQEIENTILKTLTETSDMNMILGDQKLVNQLSNSKNMSEQITQKLLEAQNTEKEIDESREAYRELAKRGSLLYQSILDLSNIDIMYKYSLQWFQTLFEKGFDQLESVTRNFEERLQALIEVQTEIIFQNVVQSIYQNHKILYTFMLTKRLQEQTHPELQKQQNNQQFQQEWNFFINNHIESSQQSTNVFPNIIPQPWWEQIIGQIDKLQEIEKFSKIKKNCFKTYKQEFLDFFLSEYPFKEDQFFKVILDDDYTQFDKLILIKAFRIDKLPQSIELYVLNYLGKNLMKHLDIVEIHSLLKYNFQDNVPVIFLLQNGIDPREQFLRYAEEQNMTKKNIIVSLGQGQGKSAEQKIRLAKQRGHWVLLQNCHLATSWMTDLDRIVNQSELEQKIQIQKGYRLWLTTNSTPNFPLSILQNSIKITISKSQGIKSNLTNIYHNMSDLDLNDCNQVEQFQKILFGLSLFHSIIQERIKFGPIGWNTAYDFTDQDLTISILQIKNIIQLEEQNLLNIQNKKQEQQIFGDQIFQSFAFLIGEIQFGGKVSDYHDRKFIVELLKNYINKNSLETGYQFCQELDIYYQIEPLNIKNYQQYISNLPSQTDPRALGLHQNSNISIGKDLANDILVCLQLSQNQNIINLKSNNDLSQDSSSMQQSSINSLSSQDLGQSDINNENEPAINFVLHFIKQKIPQKFDLDEIKKNFQITYEQSYNSVLYQESIRYNVLLQVINKSLEEMELAFKGLRQLDAQLEQMSENLLQQKIPFIWQQYGFQSLKPLAGWIKELNDRVNYLHDWIIKGEPIAFWLGAFFQPKIFIIATKLNFARKNQVVMQHIKSETLVLNKQVEKLIKPPNNGCYIYGIYLEGGKWDQENYYIVDQNPLELFSQMPPIHLKPVTHSFLKPYLYKCPIYQTPQRSGKLNSTGENNNFVINFSLVCNQEQNEQFWLFRGLAGFLSLKN